MAAVSGDYQFSAEPRTVADRRTRYREPGEQQGNINIMHDRRVVRGNTYAAMVIPASTQQELERQQEFGQKKRRRTDDQAPTVHEDEERDTRTPEPVEGRVHIETQTGPLLEELRDKPPEKESEAQTEFYIDRPPSPLFTPKLSGDCVYTQIEEGELFDFDTEVIPILDVIMDKTLEQSRLEVLEEHELQNMRERQRKFEQIRNQELLEVQRLEAEEIRKHQEGERRKLQSRTRRDQMQLAHQKYVSRILSKRLLNGLQSGSESALRYAGVLRDPRRAALERQLVPWLMNSTMSRGELKNSLRTFFKQAARDGVQAIGRLHHEAIQRHRALLDEQRRERDMANQETQQRKDNRRQKRALREGERQRKILSERIEAEIIQNGVTRDNVTTQQFSDIDARCQDLIIGTPGGLFGELIVFVASVEELIERTFAEEDLQKFLQQYVLHGMRSPTFQYANTGAQQFNEFLSTFDGNVSLTNWHTLPEDVQIQLFGYLRNQQNAFPGTSITEIWNNLEEFKIRKSIIEHLIVILFKFLIQAEQPEAIASQLRQKVEIKLLDYPETPSAQAVVRIRIPLKHDEFRDPDAQEEQHFEDPDTYREEEKEDKGHEIENIEDRVLMITPQFNDLSVYVIHQAAQRFLRNELVNFFKSLPEWSHIDEQALRQIYNRRAEHVEETLIKRLAKNLPVFDFERN